MSKTKDRMTTLIEEHITLYGQEHRYHMFSGEDVARRLQRILSACQDKHAMQEKCVAAPNKTTRTQAALRAKPEVCEKCRSTMRYTWGRSENGWRIRTFVCTQLECGHKIQRKARMSKKA